MEIEIQNTSLEDIETIFALYEDAMAYQKKVGTNYWLGFKPALIAKEIEEQRHFKILAEGKIAVTFCTTLYETLIWKNLNDTPAIYIHRIATSQFYRGNNFLKHIINWARQFAKANRLSYIRMDTGSGNDRLTNYYVKNGFTLLGNTPYLTPRIFLHIIKMAHLRCYRCVLNVRGNIFCRCCA